MKTFKEFINEDAPATSVASGAVVTLNPGEIPPVPAGVTTKNHMLRRKKPVSEENKYKMNTTATRN